MPLVYVSSRVDIFLHVMNTRDDVWALGTEIPLFFSSFLLFEGLVVGAHKPSYDIYINSASL